MRTVDRVSSGMRAMWRLIAVALLSSGCASIPADYELHRDRTPSLELVETPFFPQERYQCGPAALATVLTASGANKGPEDLVDRVYLPARRGSLQIELQAAARAAGRVAYRIDSGMDALVAELAAGRPVLILQNLGVSWLPRWHYAVVVGVDVDRDIVILRSGTERRRKTASRLFLRTWRRSDYWGLVVLDPGDLPANPDRERYFQAVADFEATGPRGGARTAWAAAAKRWPESTLPVFGLATAALSEGDYFRAEQLYRRIVSNDAEHYTAINNLAYAIARQGERGPALRLLADSMVRFADSPEKQALLRDSYEEIRHWRE